MGNFQWMSPWPAAGTLLFCRRVLPYPQSIAVWIIKSELQHAVKGGAQVGDIQPISSHPHVVLNYVFRIQVENGLAGRVRRMIDRLIHY